MLKLVHTSFNYRFTMPLFLSMYSFSLYVPMSLRLMSCLISFALAKPGSRQREGNKHK